MIIKCNQLQRKLTLFCLVFMFCNVVKAGILYPRASESREVKSLQGIWRFRSSPPNKQDIGFNQQWFLRDLEQSIPMPVPSSFNDITTDEKLRDFIGWVWYQRRFFAPIGWKTERVFIRFGSVHYSAEVFLNGKFVGKHVGGHLPFKMEITNVIDFGNENLVTVAVNNTLTDTTIPQGSITHTNDTKKYPPGYIVYDHEYRYFNYAGLHRPVFLYTVPYQHIDDVNIITELQGSTGIIHYSVNVSEPTTAHTCHLDLLDSTNTVVMKSDGLSGDLVVKNAKLWWPRLSNHKPGYLYTLQITLKTQTSVDVYRLNIGIRTVGWNSTNLLINGRPMYMQGFGKHEDLDVIGRGLDTSALVRDFQLMDWLGANSFRTSHYPYSEELLDLTDRHGYMVIMEAPACALKFFSADLLLNHEQVIREMVERDKNRPSVVMWSLANEPYSDANESAQYFSTLVNQTKLLDPSRPVTFVTSRMPHTDKAVQYVDIICANRYPSWYDDAGKTELIKHQVVYTLTQWHKDFNKSVIVTEYGAGSVPGWHTLPGSMWTEEYQVDLLNEHFHAFDLLRPTADSPGFLTGEMIWNFADFATQQEIIRPGFCMKGLFTRQRQPKMAAHFVRERYRNLTKRKC